MKIVISRPDRTYDYENIATVPTRTRPYGRRTGCQTHYQLNCDVPMHRYTPQLLLGAENGPFKEGPQIYLQRIAKVGYRPLIYDTSLFYNSYVY